VRGVVAVEEVRFVTPLYSVAEAARMLDVPTSTFAAWARGYTKRRPGRPDVIGAPVVTATAGTQGQQSVPFIGLAEGLVLAAIRRQGVPLQRIRPALDVLTDELGIEHALASRRLYTDGAEILFDYARSLGEAAAPASDLVVVRNGQRVFTDVVEAYLRRITFAVDGWATRITLPQYQQATVIADPHLSFGQPVFAHGGARLADALGMFWAGEDLDTVAAEYGMSRVEVEDAVRVASRRAA
jgi:uncharacterized protein (DUF433 family)